MVGNADETEECAPIHQQSALRHLIGKICHVYIDDTIIWSKHVKEHLKHICLVMMVLHARKLYCKLKKCILFRFEVYFLGHHISQKGIEANSRKADKTLKWLVPKSTTDVQAFLGLIWYISVFLPKLVDHTCVLIPCTTKDAHHTFLPWDNSHQKTFKAIKAFVVSREYLMVTDHTCNIKPFVPAIKSDFLYCENFD